MGLSLSDAAEIPQSLLTSDVPAGWFDRPMRWVQLTLVENDPGPLRSAVLARLLPAPARRRRDAQRRRHRRLLPDRGAAAPPQRLARRQRSVRRRSSPGCRALGMHVVARTDPHAVRDDVRAAHPDWIAVTRDGEPRRHWANPDLWVTCALGPYNFEFMDQVHREIVTTLQGRRHLREPLGAAGRRLLLRALPGRISGPPPGSICRAPADPTRSGAARVSRVAQGAADRAVEAVGRDRARGEPRRRGSFPTVRPI